MKIDGPNADAVNSVVERAKKITAAEAKKLAAARYAALDSAWDVARRAAWSNARRGAWDAAGGAAWNAAGGNGRIAVRGAAGDAAQAAVVRDLISDAHFQALAGPWESVMGPIFKKDE